MEKIHGLATVSSQTVETYFRSIDSLGLILVASVFEVGLYLQAHRA